MPSLPITGWIHPLPTMTFDLADAIDATTSGDLSPVIRSPEGQEIRIFTEMFPAAQRYIQEHFVKMGIVWINPRGLLLASTSGGRLSITTRHGRRVYPRDVVTGFPVERLAQVAGLAQIGPQSYASLEAACLFLPPDYLRINDLTYLVRSAYQTRIHDAVAASWIKVPRSEGYTNPARLALLTPDQVQGIDGIYTRWAPLPFATKAAIRKAVPWIPVAREISVNPAHVADVRDREIIFAGKVSRLSVSTKAANRVREALRQRAS